MPFKHLILCAPRKKAQGHIFLLPGKILRTHTCWLLVVAKECPLPRWKTMCFCVYKFRHPLVFLHSTFSKVVLCCLLHWIQWMRGVNCLNIPKSKTQLKFLLFQVLAMISSLPHLSHIWHLNILFHVRGSFPYLQMCSLPSCVTLDKPLDPAEPQSLHQ